MKNLRMLAMAVLVAFALSSTTGCKEKGPAEKTGEEIDKAMEESAKKMEKFKEDAKAAIEEGKSK